MRNHREHRDKPDPAVGIDVKNHRDHLEHRDATRSAAVQRVVSEPEVLPAEQPGLKPEHFVFVGPQNKLLCTATREMWERAAVDARFGPRVSDAIAKRNFAEQMSW